MLTHRGLAELTAKHFGATDMTNSKNNRFANGFRWSWKISLALLLIGVGEIILGTVIPDLHDFIVQGAKVLMLIPGWLFIGFILGFIFASDVSKEETK
jgi:cytochrome c biogenesis protein CcdA